MIESQLKKFVESDLQRLQMLDYVEQIAYDIDYHMILFTTFRNKKRIEVLSKAKLDSCERYLRDVEDSLWRSNNCPLEFQNC